MYWVCPDCSEEFDWATDGETLCVQCRRTSREVRGIFDTRVPIAVSAWLCVPCGGEYPQPNDDAARCFKCHRTFAGLVRAGLMPTQGTVYGETVEEPPRSTAKPIPENPD
jgi:DNA-directed RNA polymerase subunit RPC12/RpoP